MNVKGVVENYLKWIMIASGHENESWSNRIEMNTTILSLDNYCINCFKTLILPIHWYPPTSINTNVQLIK